MSSSVESRIKRWRMEARVANNGRALPSWTRDDDDNEDIDQEENAVPSDKKRRVVRKRSDTSVDSNVLVSKLQGSRHRRRYDIPGYSFRETSQNEKRGDDDSGIPGNSLRESSVNPEPTSTAAATSTSVGDTATNTLYITGGAVTSEATQIAITTTSAQAIHTHVSHHASASSESDDSDSDAEKDEATQSSAIATSAPAVSTIGSSQNYLEPDNTHSDVHKILLGVGCVVGFILIASVLLIAWKVRKRNQRRRAGPFDDTTFNKPSRVDRILTKVPFVRNHFTNRQQWYTIPDPASKVTIEKSRGATLTPRLTTRRVGSGLFVEKPIGLGLYGADFSQSASTIDTTFVPSGKPTSTYNAPQVSSRLRASPETVSSMHDFPDTQSKKGSPKTSPETVSPMSGGLPRTQSSRSRANSVAVSPVSTMYVEDTAVQVQVVSRQAPKPIRLSGGRTQEEDVPPLPTPKWDFRHLKRQTGASDLSSISSGFGDGDIIITADNTVTTVNTARLPTPPSPVANPSRESSMRWHRIDSLRGVSSRQSSLRSYRTNTGSSTRQSSLRTDSRRDTVSTQASIDSRPRFHSVSSWVKQQTGQMRRAEQSGNTPPVPMLPPPEPEMRYMMPDGEEPRRPDQM